LRTGVSEQPGARRVVRLAPPLGLTYMLVIGGTPAGELLAPLRIVNTAIAAIFVVLYVRRVGTRSDWIDRAILVALLLSAIVMLTSAFPRQSLDAFLAALTYAAIFYVARDLLLDPVVRRWTLWVMRAVCVAVVVLVASRLIAPAIEWMSLTGGELPPVGLALSARPWGHAYDLVLLGVLLFPSWLVGPIGRSQLAGAAIVGTVLGAVVLLLGARAIWLAVALSAAAIVIPMLIDRLRQGSTTARWGAIAFVALGLIAAVALWRPIVDRLTDAATVGQRLAMWTSATEAWLERPISGYGLGSFPWILQTTDHFDTNSIHPRHPDSAIFQLLPEAGLLGVVAVVIVIVAIGWPLVRDRKALILWPLLTFLLAGIGANPSDFSYLVIVAIVWAAIGLPRLGSAVESVVPQSRVIWLASATLLGIAGVVVSLTLIAGVSYDAAARSAAADDLPAARRQLDLAATLDPSMALYARQRGIASLLMDDPNAAVADLAKATRLNPSDDLAWRALSVARSEVGDGQAARDALSRAIELQRSDPTNLLLRARQESEDGDLEALEGTAAEILLAWPTLGAAPGWSDLTAGLLPADVIAASIARWQRGDPSPEPLLGQPLWLIALADRDDLVAEATGLAGESTALADAAVAVLRCDPATQAILDSIPADDRRSNTYWSLRVQNSADLGAIDRDALRLYQLVTGNEPSQASAQEQMNPLQENNAQGSVDAWGYDRAPIVWPGSPFTLPLPSAGSARWMFDPDGAREEMGFMSGPGGCLNR
jgi:O-antigen ligase/tetratricopeptide (TPR) repeat protein